jgi:hypothetical protein
MVYWLDNEGEPWSPVGIPFSRKVYLTGGSGASNAVATSAMHALPLILKGRDDILAVDETFVIHALLHSSPGHSTSHSTVEIPSSTGFKEMYEALLATVGHEYGILTGQFITPEEWDNLQSVPIHATWALIFPGSLPS